MDWILELYIGSNKIKKCKLDLPEIKIGRGKGNHINLPATVISRNHALLSLANNYVVLEDLQSTNGTYYRDQRIERVYLKEGDFFIIGPYGFKLIKSFFEDAVNVSEFPLSIGSDDTKTSIIDKEVKEKIIHQMNGLDDTHISFNKKDDKS